MRPTRRRARASRRSTKASARATAAEVWKRAVRFRRPNEPFDHRARPRALVSDGDRDKGKLQLLDYDTGEPLWGNKGRGIEIAGQVVDYSFAGTDLVLTTGYDSIWTNKDTAYLLYVLDTDDGQLQVREAVRGQGAHARHRAHRRRA